jgi:hypothetical protein
LKRYVSSISVAHTLKGLKFETSAPVLKTILKGITRERGSDRRKVRPLMANAVRGIIDTAEPTIIDWRDCALLALGLAFAARRSERHDRAPSVPLPSHLRSRDRGKCPCV